MSQSNYINHLRDSTILKEQRKLPYVLNAKDYTQYKSFSLINTIPNTKNSFSQLSSNGNTNIFDMEKNTMNCSRFQLCKNTNQRINRDINTIQLPVPTKVFNKNVPEKVCICNNKKYSNLGASLKCKTRFSMCLVKPSKFKSGQCMC